MKKRIPIVFLISAVFLSFGGPLGSQELGAKFGLAHSHADITQEIPGIAYQSMNDFVSEVIRVLRPGGFFSWTDILWKQGLDATNQYFRKSELRMIREWDITPSVLRALELDHDRQLNIIKCLAPKFMHRMICEFAAVKGTQVYRSLENRKRVYLSKVFQKV